MQKQIPSPKSKLLNFNILILFPTFYIPHKIKILFPFRSPKSPYNLQPVPVWLQGTEWACVLGFNTNTGFLSNLYFPLSPLTQMCAQVLEFDWLNVNQYSVVPMQFGWYPEKYPTLVITRTILSLRCFTTWIVIVNGYNIEHEIL